MFPIEYHRNLMKIEKKLPLNNMVKKNEKFILNNMESCYQRLKYALSGCLEIHPCVLHDISPLGLPPKSVKKLTIPPLLSPSTTSVSNSSLEAGTAALRLQP